MKLQSYGKEIKENVDLMIGGLGLFVGIVGVVSLYVYTCNKILLNVYQNGGELCSLEDQNNRLSQGNSKVIGKYAIASYLTDIKGNVYKLVNLKICDEKEVE